MDLDADAVTGAVAEEFAVARSVYDVPCRRVRILAGNAGREQVKRSELSFEDAVEQYSEDTGSKEKKGDVGWDKLTTFVDSYQTALEGLNKGDVSDVVESTYGYHIIKCTDYFHVDNQVDDINQVPKDIKKYVSNVVKTQAASTAYSEWLEQYKKDADITVNPMPKDVPYNVSLKGVTKSSTDDSSTTK